MTTDTGRADTAFEPVLTAGAQSALGSPAVRWLLAPAAAAWLALLWLSGGHDSVALCVAPRATLFEGWFATTAAGFAAVTPSRWAVEWTLMIVAMMFPLVYCLKKY